MLPVTVTQFSFDGIAIRYVLPVLWITTFFDILQRMGRIRDDEYFCRVRQVAAPVGRQTLRRYVWSKFSDGGTGDKVCRLRLNPVIHWQSPWPWVPGGRSPPVLWTACSYSYTGYATADVVDYVGKQWRIHDFEKRGENHGGLGPKSPVRSRGGAKGSMKLKRRSSLPQNGVFGQAP